MLVDRDFIGTSLFSVPGCCVSSVFKNLFLKKGMKSEIQPPPKYSLTMFMQLLNRHSCKVGMDVQSVFQKYLRPYTWKLIRKMELSAAV